MQHAHSLPPSTTQRHAAALTAAAALCRGGGVIKWVVAVVGEPGAGVVVEEGGAPPPQWAAPTNAGRGMAYCKIVAGWQSDIRIGGCQSTVWRVGRAAAVVATAARWCGHFGGCCTSVVPPT